MLPVVVDRVQFNVLICLKPIFHCDKKILALGNRAGGIAQLESFGLGIPTCWHIKTLKFALPQRKR